MTTDLASLSSNPLKRQHVDEVTISNVIENNASDTLPTNPSNVRRPSTPTDAHCTNASKDMNASHSRSSSILSDIGEHTPPPPTPPAARRIQIQVSALPNGQQNAFSALNGVPEPPKKKVKLTFAEQEDRRIRKEIAAAEKAQEKAQEKEKREREKREKEAEREAERRKRDAEREAERAAKEAEKEEKRLLKEVERKKKDDEKREAEEAKKRKERSQPKLNAFFGKPAVKREKETSPEKMEVTAETAETKEQSKDTEAEEYDKRWPPFFVQNGVTMAQPPGQRDERARKKLEEEINACLSGSKHVEPPTRFSVTEAFNMPSICFARRGTKHVTPVRDIMAELLGTGASSRPIDLTTESHNRKLKSARKALRQVRFKILKFAEDVRPPYTGTYTKEPSIPLARLARNPLRRVRELDYEYDSEAEWEEPGEDEEDLGSEDDEDEVEGEGDDFDGFLDDADDEVAKGRRLQMVGDNLEPVSTGLCFEDELGRVSCVEVARFKMNVLNGKYTYFYNPVHQTMMLIYSVEHIKSNEPIDPFSAAYWPSPIAQSTSMNPPRIPLNALKNTTSPPPTAHSTSSHTAKITDMFNIKPSSSSARLPSGFGTPLSSSTSSTTTKNPVGRRPKDKVEGEGKEKKLVPEEYMEAFKNAVEGSDLSKIGLIEVLNKSFKGVKKGDIKNTLERFAERKGVVEREKRWVWKE